MITIKIILRQRAINSSNISLIEIYNLTNLVISVISKKEVNQKATLQY